MTTRDILDQAKQRRAAAYGPRLKAMVLHGSEARSEAREDSDIDLLVVLEPPLRLGEEVRTIVDALYPLILESGRILDAQPVGEDLYQAGEYAVNRAARREGVVR